MKNPGQFCVEINTFRNYRKSRNNSTAERETGSHSSATTATNPLILLIFMFRWRSSACFRASAGRSLVKYAPPVPKSPLLHLASRRAAIFVRLARGKATRNYQGVSVFQNRFDDFSFLIILHLHSVTVEFPDPEEKGVLLDDLGLLRDRVISFAWTSHR